jgi:hypothetical protein
MNLAKAEYGTDLKPGPLYRRVSNFQEDPRFSHAFIGIHTDSNIFAGFYLTSQAAYAVYKKDPDMFSVSRKRISNIGELIKTFTVKATKNDLSYAKCFLMFTQWAQEAFYDQTKYYKLSEYYAWFKNRSKSTDEQAHRFVESITDAVEGKEGSAKIEEDIKAWSKWAEYSIPDYKKETFEVDYQYDPLFKYLRLFASNESILNNYGKDFYEQVWTHSDTISSYTHWREDHVKHYNSLAQKSREIKETSLTEMTQESPEIVAMRYVRNRESNTPLMNYNIYSISYEPKTCCLSWHVDGREVYNHTVGTVPLDDDIVVRKNGGFIIKDKINMYSIVCGTGDALDCVNPDSYHRKIHSNDERDATLIYVSPLNGGHSAYFYPRKSLFGHYTQIEDPEAFAYNSSSPPCINQGASLNIRRIIAPQSLDSDLTQGSMYAQYPLSGESTPLRS